jgi:hypothetical protein
VNFVDEKPRVPLSNFFWKRIKTLDLEP